MSSRCPVEPPGALAEIDQGSEPTSQALERHRLRDPWDVVGDGEAGMGDGEALRF